MKKRGKGKKETLGGLDSAWGHGLLGVAKKIRLALEEMRKPRPDGEQDKEKNKPNELKGYEDFKHNVKANKNTMLAIMASFREQHHPIRKAKGELWQR
ncbi:unnamed protein product, partial [Chrysoparadoxa australica]